MAAIDDNPIHQVITSDKLTSTGKASVLTGILSSGDPDALNDFKEYQDFLRDERKKMLAEIINPTGDASVHGDLKSTIASLRKGVDDFNKSMQPLTEITQALRGLLAEDGKQTIGQPVAAPADRAQQPLEFDGVLDHSVSVRTKPLSLKARYMMMRC